MEVTVSPLHVFVLSTIVLMFNCNLKFKRQCISITSYCHIDINSTYN